MSYSMFFLEGVELHQYTGSEYSIKCMFWVGWVSVGLMWGFIFPPKTTILIKFDQNCVLGQFQTLFNPKISILE